MKEKNPKTKKPVKKKAKAEAVQKELVQTKGRVLEGVVASDKMDKTIVVEVTRLMSHPQYTKVIRQKIRYAAHDEKNEAKSGEKVRIVESRPLSKRKRWQLVKVIK